LSDKFAEIREELQAAKEKRGISWTDLANEVAAAGGPIVDVERIRHLITKRRAVPQETTLLRPVASTLGLDWKSVRERLYGPRRP
jgi:hypothetical protein